MSGIVTGEAGGQREDMKRRVGPKEKTEAAEDGGGKPAGLGSAEALVIAVVERRGCGNRGLLFAVSTAVRSPTDVSEVAGFHQTVRVNKTC